MDRWEAGKDTGATKSRWGGDLIRYNERCIFHLSALGRLLPTVGGSVV